MGIVIGCRVDFTTYESATKQTVEWARANRGHYVCVANVHMLMEAYDCSEFQGIVNDSDLTVPDGVPLVWMMRAKGVRHQERVYGPTLMLHILESAARAGIPVGFYGGSLETLESLVQHMQARYENLKVAYSYSPPYRAMSFEEDALIIEQISQSGTRILFIGLGCPKQEIWMAGHRGKVNAVMIGVGAAFDFHSGVKPQAPAWMQKIGLEWLFRLINEPRRLWRRYLYHNPRFLVLAMADLLGLVKG